MTRDGSADIKCYSCGEVKPAADFAWRRRSKGQRDSFCRPCRAAYKRRHYAANKPRYVANAKAMKERLRRERTAFLLAFFADHPCTDCGESDPVVLEFDHLGDKLFNIASALDGRPWAAILAEMDKCEVVCCNCHRRRTSRRRGALRVRLTEWNEAGGEN